MFKFLLSTDSSCDEYKTNLAARNIEYIPLSYAINEASVFDHYSQKSDYRSFYDLVREGAMPKTSQISIYDHVEYFESLFNKQTFDIVHISLSSGLSNTYNNAVKAAEEVMAKYPGRKIYAVDSKAATQGQALLLSLAESARSGGKTAEEAYDYLVQMSDRIHHWILVQDLNHLHRGGRVSKAVAVVGTLLQIKPILVINHLGKLAVVDKVKGFSKGLRYFVNQIGKHAKDINNQTVYIAHADCEDNAEELKNIIQEDYNCDVRIGWVGPIIGTHVGPGMIGMVFLSDSRLEVGEREEEKKERLEQKQREKQEKQELKEARKEAKRNK